MLMLYLRIFNIKTCKRDLQRNKKKYLLRKETKIKNDDIENSFFREGWLRQMNKHLNVAFKKNTRDHIIIIIHGYMYIYKVFKEILIFWEEI